MLLPLLFAVHGVIKILEVLPRCHDRLYWVCESVMAYSSYLYLAVHLGLIAFTRHDHRASIRLPFWLTRVRMIVALGPLICSRATVQAVCLVSILVLHMVQIAFDAKQFSYAMEVVMSVWVLMMLSLPIMRAGKALYR